MKGSIRTGIGFLMAFGAVGGIDTGAPLIPAVTLAIVGLLIMASGVRAIKTV